MSHHQEILKLQKELKASQSLNAAQSRIIHKLEKDLEGTKSSLETAERENTSLSSELEQVKSSLNIEQTKYQVLESECGTLRQTIVTMGAMLERLIPKLTDATIRVAVNL
jgi:chromosome segregation ATPase